MKAGHNIVLCVCQSTVEEQIRVEAAGSVYSRISPLEGNQECRG